MTLSLHELQQELVDGLDSKSENILNYIRHSSTLTSKKHLEIYRNSMIGNLQKSLKEIYPVCHRLVGDEFFLGMINLYIPTAHSFSPDIGDYGSNFANFIEQFEPANSLPYLADVARLEWAWHNIYSVPENSVFDFQELAECYTTSGEKIVFSLPAGSFLLKSSYPIHRIWEVNQKNFSGIQTITLEEGSLFHYLVWRDRLDMRIDPLTADEWQILTWMQEKMPLGQICEKAAEEYPETDVVTVLPQLINNGYLTDFTLA